MATLVISVEGLGGSMPCCIYEPFYEHKQRLDDQAHFKNWILVNHNNEIAGSKNIVFYNLDVF